MYTRIQELSPPTPKCTSTVGLCLYSTHIRYCSPIRKGRLGNTLAASRKMRQGKVKNTIIRLLNTSRTHPGACIRPILIPSPSIQQIRGSRIKSMCLLTWTSAQITWFPVPPAPAAASNDDVTTSQAAALQVRQALQHCRHYASRYVQKVIVFGSFASQTQPLPDLEETYSSKCFVIWPVWLTNKAITSLGLVCKTYSIVTVNNI